MSEQNNINDEGDDLRRWRTELSNLADDLGLSVYAFRLYGHIKRRCGANGGTCTASTRALAEKCKMSVGKVSDSKRELIDAGLISIEKVDGPHGPEDNITIIDIWLRNFEHFSEQAEAKMKRSQGEHKRSSHERMSSPHERKRSPGEPKKEPIEEGTKEEENPPADAGRAPAHHRDVTLTPEGDLEPGEELQDGDTVIIDGQTYTFKATPTGAPGEIQIAGAEETLRNLQEMADRHRAGQIDTDIDIEIPGTPGNYSWQRTADYTASLTCSKRT